MYESVGTVKDLNKGRKKKLKVLPHVDCGGLPEFVNVFYEIDKDYYVRCPKCGYKMYSYDLDRVEQVVERWNNLNSGKEFTPDCHIDTIDHRSCAFCKFCEKCSAGTEFFKSHTEHSHVCRLFCEK